MGQSIRIQILCTWLIVLLMFVVFRFSPDQMILVYVLNLWLFNFPHTVATYFVPKTSERFSSKQLFVLFSVLAVCLFCIQIFLGKVALMAIYFYWQIFHYARQNYGLLRLNSGDQNDLFWICQLSYLFPLLSMSYLFAKGYISFLGYSIPLFLIPMNPQYFIYLYIFLAFIFIYKASRVSINFLLLAISHVLIFSISYLLMDNLNMAWPLMNAQHCLMYLFVVDQVSFKNLKKSLPIFLGAGLCLYVPIYFLGHIQTQVSLWVDITSFVMLVFTFGHYYIDGFIWSVKKR